MLIDYDTTITINSDDILDELGVSDIEEYLEDQGIGYYYLYDEDDVEDQLQALARFMNELLTNKENTKELIKQLSSLLNLNTIGLLKDELNKKSKK